MSPLPDELLILILGLRKFSPLELAQYCLVSKQWRGISVEMLYRKITIKQSPLRLHLLLRTAVENPPLARLVKHFVIHWEDSFYLDDRGNCHLASDYSNFSQISQLYDVQDDIIRFLRNEAPGSRALYLLLHLLSNLKSFKGSLPDRSFEMVMMQEVSASRLLPNLQSFSRLQREAVDAEDINASPFLPLFLLPSLRTLNATSLSELPFRDYENPLPHQFPTPHFFGTSNVITLGLEKASIPPSALAAFCKLPKALTELRYGYRCHHTQRGHPLNLSSVGNAIEGASSSLQRLALRLHPSKEPVATTIGSLRSFRVLKMLTISPELLFDFDLSKVNFSKLLPPSLEQLVFCWSQWPTERIIQALTLLLLEKSHHPKLKTIGLAQTFDFDSLLEIATPLNVQVGSISLEDPFLVVPFWASLSSTSVHFSRFVPSPRPSQPQIPLKSILKSRI